jgi:hypothetical protein
MAMLRFTSSFAVAMTLTADVLTVKAALDLDPIPGPPDIFIQTVGVHEVPETPGGAGARRRRGSSDTGTRRGSITATVAEA